MKKLLYMFAFLSLTLTLNAQFVEQTSGVTTSLRSVSVVDQLNAWASGASGVVLRTTNGGTNWTSVGGTTFGTSTLHNIYAVNATTALVCANPSTAGQLWRTTDAGATWTKVLEQTGGFFNAVVMLSPTNGFLTGDPVGGRWSNFKTANGGATWDTTGMFLAQAGTEAGWNNGIYVMGTHVWFGTNNSRVYHSTNSTASFTSQPTGSLVNSFGIKFTSLTRGLIGGSTSPVNLVSTTDGGTSWTTVPVLGGTTTVYSVLGLGNYWYYSQGTRVFQSTDNGATWDTIYVAAAGTVNHMQQARNGSDFVIGVRSNGGIFKATGLNLPVELTSFSASALNGAVVLNWTTATEINNRGFEVQRKSAGGEFVTIGFVKGAGTSTESVSYSYSDRVPFGNYSYRLKQVDFNGQFEYSQVVEVKFIALSEYALEQNYPNPFNPSTTIRFNVKDPGLVTLKVYNVLGNEVAQLLNGEMEAGIHELTFNASNLSSGVYFYTIQAGNFSETKKMLLMK